MPTPPPDNKLPAKIEFVQYHQPALKEGTYEVTVAQEIETKEASNKKIPQTSFSITKRFVVLGERFELKPADIRAVFPPPGSLGDHSNVLPHIILSRSTLPWERIALAGDDTLPWLALLLFDEAETPTPQVITLGELKNTNAYPAKFPAFDLEIGQRDDDKVTVIDVPKTVLEPIMPTPADLAYLAHVRQAKDNNGKLVGDEMAVVIGNRLPRAGSTCTVHLVSLEGRYNDEGLDDQGAGDDDLIRLVSLNSWGFACVDEQQSFKGLLLNLNREPNTLRLPQNTNPQAESYLQMGYVPLPHTLRQSEKTISWYHGPLTTGANPTSHLKLPVHAADELMRYNPATGMFDVSYAAAWELGRLLALQNKRFSIDLYQWKRNHVQQLKQAEQQLLHPHLPPLGQPAEEATTSTENSTTKIRPEISGAFERLARLEGMPFNYLVPAEQMLPPESIRFFQVDWLWVESLLDGAFSIGRVTSADHRRDETHEESPAANPYGPISGFLIRSTVVAGWPGLLVDGYNQVIDNVNFVPNTQKLNLLRMERLSEDVLLCLFEGDVQTVDIHQKPEMLHFGLDKSDGNDPLTYYKTLRDRAGRSSGTKVTVPWKDESKRVVNIAEKIDGIDGLALAIQAHPPNGNGFTSAQFALEMIEGVDKVRFVKFVSQ
jgi:hypothetical protein